MPKSQLFPNLVSFFSRFEVSLAYFSTAYAGSLSYMQTITAVILVQGAKLFGYVEYPPFEFKIALQWLPVNIFFVGMLCSGFFRYFFSHLQWSGRA
jgi:hypothetical protein